MRPLYWLRLAARRLQSRMGLSLLSLLGVALAVGMITSIPLFSQGVSAFVLRQELAQLSRLAGRPLFAVRAYYLASAARPLPWRTVLQMGPGL